MTLRIELGLDGRSGVVLESYSYVTPSTPFTVPKGFVTDFASVPRMLWAFIPPLGTYSRAACLHDYLYRNQVVSKREADWVFNAKMKQDDVKLRYRLPLYWAVRLFGGKVYKGYSH